MTSDTAKMKERWEGLARGDADALRDLSLLGVETLAEIERLEAELRQCRKEKNELVLRAYPALDAIDAIGARIEQETYENDTLTVSQIRRLLPENLNETNSPVARLRADRDEAFRLLGISAERFRFYESQHRNNGTPHGDRMAEINAEQAAEIETFLANHKEAGSGE